MSGNTKVRVRVTDSQGHVAERTVTLLDIINRSQDVAVDFMLGQTVFNDRFGNKLELEVAGKGVSR